MGKSHREASALVQEVEKERESRKKEVISPESLSLIIHPLNRGGIAQLVERLLCKQDVSGSNPLTSTNR